MRERIRQSVERENVCGSSRGSAGSEREGVEGKREGKRLEQIYPKACSPPKPTNTHADFQPCED